MRHFITALGLSLFLHVLLLSMVPGWVKSKSEVRMLPQSITLLLSQDQSETIIPIQERKPEEIQRISVPEKINNKKKQINSSPKKIKRSVQTMTTSDLLKKIKSPVRLMEPQKAKPEKKIQTKVEPASVYPVKYKFPTEQKKTGMYEKSSDIYMSPEEDSKRAVLSYGEGNVFNPHDKGLTIVIPHYKGNPTPPYPALARRRGYQGIVMLKVLINHVGKVDETLLLQSSGYFILDRAAIASVKNWVFEPGKKGDETVNMWVKVPIRFQLK